MQNLGNVISVGSPLCYEQNRCAGEWSAPLKIMTENSKWYYVQLRCETEDGDTEDGDIVLKDLVFCGTIVFSGKEI